jgi:tRNA pseudouridine55 synthase
VKPTRQPIDGVLLLNKPVGITSNAALQKAKWLLPLCFGEATKFSAYLLDADKRYRAVLQLGVTTTTGDPEGEVLSRQDVHVSRADLLAVLPRFMGEIEQIPPMHSALKHQGRPLYEYARAGIEIERPPRKVHIRALDVVECTPPRVVLDVQSSAGTYIRTLAQDIGAALGCGAHLTALTRTAAGGFSLEQAHTLADLDPLEASQRLAWLQPADCLVAHLPMIQLNDDDTQALCQGRSVVHPTSQQGLIRMYTTTHRFIGLASGEDGHLVPRRLIATQ